MTTPNVSMCAAHGLGKRSRTEEPSRKVIFYDVDTLDEIDTLQRTKNFLIDDQRYDAFTNKCYRLDVFEVDNNNKGTNHPLYTPLKSLIDDTEFTSVTMGSLGLTKKGDPAMVTRLDDAFQLKNSQNLIIITIHHKGALIGFIASTGKRLDTTVTMNPNATRTTRHTQDGTQKYEILLFVIHKQYKNKKLSRIFMAHLIEHIHPSSNSGTTQTLEVNFLPCIENYAYLYTTLGFKKNGNGYSLDIKDDTIKNFKCGWYDEYENPIHQ